VHSDLDYEHIQLLSVIYYIIAMYCAWCTDVITMPLALWCLYTMNINGYSHRCLAQGMIVFYGHL